MKSSQGKEDVNPNRGKAGRERERDQKKKKKIQQTLYMKHAENPGKEGGEGLGRSKIPSLAGNRRSPCLSEEQTSLRVVHVCVSLCVCVCVCV